MQAAPHRRDGRNEWQVNRPAQQHCQLIPAPSDCRSTGWGSTLGQFFQSNILQLNPYQHEISESVTDIRSLSQMNSSRDHRYLNQVAFDCWEAAKHTGVSDCQTFTVSIPWDSQQNLTSKLREKLYFRSITPSFSELFLQLWELEKNLKTRKGNNKRLHSGIPKQPI